MGVSVKSCHCYAAARRGDERNHQQRPDQFLQRGQVARVSGDDGPCNAAVRHGAQHSHLAASAGHFKLAPCTL